MRKSRHQSGLSLVELMIAMVIGLVLLAGLAQVFVTGQSSYGLQEKMGDLQENGRFALHFLQRDLRMAGYPKNDVTVKAFDIVKTVDGSGDGADTVSIRFRAPTGGIVDCAGANKAAGELVEDTFSVTKGDDGVRRLTCQGNSGNGAQPLVDGIENMQVQYGIDADSSSEDAGWGYADYYTNATEVSAKGLWNSIVSVRIAILASTINPITDEDEASQAQSFTLLDVTGIELGDKKVRGRVFTTTIEVRNRTSGV